MQKFWLFPPILNTLIWLGMDHLRQFEILFSHFSRANTPRKQGGLGSDLKLPLLADKNMQISKDYGVLIEGSGIALRLVFTIVHLHLIL
jgi:alkyl hydroperoxide reductase subunit AhpC